jgi:mannose-6-phosphate isomerase-like protein (cupin superfamily)
MTMFHILHPSDQQKGAIAGVEFEGEPYGAGISFLIGHLAPGKGPRLHRHSYSETCIVRSGKAAMMVDGKEVVAGAGDIIVIGPDTPHRFTAIGTEPLDMIAIHASDRIVIEWLSG